MGKPSASKLALLHGKKVVTRKPPRWPLIDSEVTRAVAAALKNESLSPLTGGLPAKLEKAFARFHKAKHAIMVNGGTAALHLALAACGVEPGDEVITSPYSWGATTGCILHQNAIPVFADIHPETLCLDPRRIEQWVGPKTRAIVVVHIYGMPADMGAIVQVARKHDLAVVEDCSQATGARLRGRLLGTFGHVGAFSLQASKNLTAGEGGMFLTNDPSIYQRALLFGTHPVRMQAELKDKNLLPYIDSLGFNFRPHPLGAAIALAQLRHLNTWIRNKTRNFNHLFRQTAGIAELHGAEFIRKNKGTVHGFHMVPVKITHPELRQLPRSAIVEALRREGVPVGGYVGTPIPLRPRFRDLFFYGRGCPWTCRHSLRLPDYSPGNWPVAERLCEKGEVLIYGNHYRLDLKLMDQYAAAFHKLAENVEPLRRYAARRGAR